MKKETMNGIKNAGMQIGLHGLLIPALGTLVGFIVQKKLMESEQKKSTQQQQLSSPSQPEELDLV